MKKLLAMLLVMTMVMSMSITAFAADEGEDVATDHNGSETGVSESADIGVYGTYKDTQYADTVLSVDVSWTSMNFRYAVTQQGTWNPETHTYKDSESEPEWLEDTATITLANHSNSGVKASLGYTAIATGVTGTLSKSSVELETAEGTASTNPPSDSVTFKVSGAMSSTDTALGTITVSIEAVAEPVYLDLSSVADDEIAAAVQEWLTEQGGTVVRVKMASDSTFTPTQLAAINTGATAVLGETGYSLTVSGATTLGESAFGSSRYSLNAPNLTGELYMPDVTKIAYYGCMYSSISSAVFPKVSSLQGYAFAYCSNLTSLTLGTYISSPGSGTFSETTTENITLTLSAEQDGSTWGNYYPCTWGESGTWLNKTFKTILEY